MKRLMFFGAILLDGLQVCTGQYGCLTTLKATQRQDAHFQWQFGEFMLHQEVVTLRIGTLYDRGD
ncbi:MAG: hypothetical protein IJV20_01945 [Prevotella sp.]|nr:hypothetical protein [Prevotella sp.]